jgi:hypothetical protein
MLRACSSTNQDAIMEPTKPWNNPPVIDDCAYSAVLCAAVVLACAGSLISAVEPAALVSFVNEAAQTAAALLA